MVNPIGRLEGMAKGLFNASVQTIDLFTDIADEALTGADKYEGNGVLDTIWGSWQDNVLGEGGVVQSLFGPDEFDENGNPNAAFGGHFFGSIPETVRHPAMQILNPAMEGLDLAYEYGVDRNIGTVVTYMNMVANDGIHTVVDPSSWAQAYNATGSRSWGQAFALLSRNIDLEDPDAVAQFEGTSYYNLLSGSVDLMSNWYLDPANLAAWGFAKIYKAQRVAKNAKLLASGEYQKTRQYLKFKERLGDIKKDALNPESDKFLEFSQAYRTNQGFERSDIDNLGKLGVRIREVADKGRLGNVMRGAMSDELALSFAVTSDVANKVTGKSALDLFIELLTDTGGDASKVFEKLEETAKAYAQDLYGQGKLKNELDMLTRDAQDYLKVGPDGRNLTLDEYIQKLEDGLTDRDGRALHPNRAQTAENLRFMRDLIDMEGQGLVALFDGVVLGKRVTPGQVDEARKAVVQRAEVAADQLGLRFNPALAAAVDPVGEGFFRWFRTTTTSEAYLRDKLWNDLSETDQIQLLHWAGIPTGAVDEVLDFKTNWDQLVETDRSLDGVILTARAKHRNKSGAYRPGDPEIGQRLRKAGVGRMVDAMDELLEGDPVKIPGGNLEKYLNKKRGLLSTKRVRRGRRRHAPSATVKGKPDYNSTVNANGYIQNNALKQLWDDLNKRLTERELAEPDWIIDENLKATLSKEEIAVREKVMRWQRKPHEERIEILKKLLPADLRHYIGLTIDEIVDRVPNGRNLEDGRPTAAALDVVDELYDAIGRIGLDTKRVPKLDAEGREVTEFVPRRDPKTGEYRDVEEIVYEDIVDASSEVAETADAIPQRGDYIKRWAPPRKYRDTTDWYDDVNYRPTTTQLTPEDGFDPHWQKFIDDIELSRLDKSYEWNSRWQNIVSDSPHLATALRNRTKWDDLSEEAREAIADSVSPGLTDDPDFLWPDEIAKLEKRRDALRGTSRKKIKEAQAKSEAMQEVKAKRGAGREKAADWAKSEAAELATEIRKAKNVLTGTRIGATSFEDLRKTMETVRRNRKVGAPSSLRKEYRTWISDATPEQLQELKLKIVEKAGGRLDDPATLEFAENLEAAWKKIDADERLRHFSDLVNEGTELRTTFAKTDSLEARIKEYDEFVEYSQHWDEVLDSKFDEIPEDFSETRYQEVGDIRAGANSIRELLAERHEMRRSDPGEYERPLLDEAGNQVIDDAGNPQYQRAPFADEGIGGLEAQSRIRAEYRFAMRRPTFMPEEVPMMARITARPGLLDEFATPAEQVMWYSKPGKESVKVKVSGDERTLAWDKDYEAPIMRTERVETPEGIDDVGKFEKAARKDDLDIPDEAPSGSQYLEEIQKDEFGRPNRLSEWGDYPAKWDNLSPEERAARLKDHPDLENINRRTQEKKPILRVIDEEPSVPEGYGTDPALGKPTGKEVPRLDADGNPMVQRGKWVPLREHPAFAENLERVKKRWIPPKKDVTPETPGYFTKREREGYWEYEDNPAALTEGWIFESEWRQDGRPIDELRMDAIQKIEDVVHSIKDPRHLGPRGKIFEALGDDELLRRQREIEQTLMTEYPDMPFAAALVFEDMRLKNAARRKDARDMQHENINALYDALNMGHPNLIEVVANDIISRHIPNVGALEMVPGVGRFNEVTGAVSGAVSATGRSFAEQGYVREFVHNFENKTGFPVKMPNVRVRYFVEKVAQGLIKWDDPAQGYQQFERMLRDAGRVRPKFYQKAEVINKNLLEYAGLNAEEVLGKWVQNPDRQARMALFEETVTKLNNALGQMFAERIGQWKDGKFVNTSPQELTRILRRNWKSAQKEVQQMGTGARLYSNNQIKVFRMDENRTINVRAIPMTPQQLAEASLVPRYDLYANAFSDQSKVMQAAQGVRDGVGMGLDAFTSLWKKSVLLRPAWPVRVLTDEFMRVSGEYGTMVAMRGVATGLGDLRAGLFQRQGIDLAGPIQTKMQSVLDEAGIKIEIPGSGLRPVRPSQANPDELFQAINRHFEGDHTKIQDLVKEVIYEEYGKQRIRRRLMGASAVGAWMAGPAGLAAAAVYGLYSRGSMQRLAKLETLNHVGYSLSQMGRRAVDDEILLIEKQLVKLDPDKNSDEVLQLIEKAKQLEESRKILLTQAKQYQDQFTLYDRFTGKMRERLAQRKEEIGDASNNIAAYSEGTIVQNFDTAGKIMADAGVSDYHMDGLSIGNAFGNTPQTVQIHKNSISANQYRTSLWNSASAATRKTIRQTSRKQYNVSTDGPKLFAEAFDDTVNRQWIPIQDPGAYSRPGVFRPRAPSEQMRIASTRYNDANIEYAAFVKAMNEKYNLGWDEAGVLTPDELTEFSTLRTEMLEAVNEWEEAGTFWAGQRGEAAVSTVGEIDISKQQNLEAIADAEWWRKNGGIPFTAGQNPFQDFTRLFWMDNVDDADIIAWLQHGDGRALKDAMPAHFTDNLQSVEEWVQLVRAETNNMVPNIPEFAHVRRKMSRGEEIKWTRDIQPILDSKFGGSTDTIRAAGFSDFGFIIGDSALEDAYKTHGIITRMKRWTDEAFTHLGTMPTDVLTRSTVFRTVYSAEVAKRLPNFKKSDGSYSLTQKQLNAVEGEARRIAVRKTKDLLYDLAERTKFEEMMSNMMPFFAAYQEVITRWAGISTRNPGFVLATTRNFHNGLETFNAVDEETGAPLFLLRFGTVLGATAPDWLPLLGDQKVFGRFSKLGENPIKLNLSSMSMMSGGLPGFGPVVAFAASEAATQVPSVAESFEWAFPYGLAEGGNILERFRDSVTPLWTQTAASTQFNTFERQRVRARVASDMIVEYELNGEIIESPSDLAEFEDEVDARVTAMLRLRMVANLMSPISFMYQSPHAHVISQYRKIMKAEGVEAADEWLLIDNPDFWGVVGRQTRVAEGAVASANLFGEEQFQKYPEFYKDNYEISDLLVGNIGPIDVQMASEVAYNQTVYKKEIAEGRRTYQTPEEAAKRAAANAGWFWYEKQMQPIRQKQEQLRISGLPSSLNAKANLGMKEARQMIIQAISEKYPLWREAFDNIKTAEESARVIHSLRNWVDATEISGWHPSVPHVIAYFELRDLITGTMLERSRQNGDPEMQLLSHPANEDLKGRWESGRIAFANVPDMAGVFVRYLDQDDVITRASWPKNQKAYQLGIRSAA